MAAGSRLHGNQQQQQQQPGRSGSASWRRAAPLSISPSSSSLYSFGAARQWTGSRSSPAIAFPRAIRSTFADEAMHRRARDTTHYVRYADTAAKTGVLRFMNPTERPAFSREAPRSAKSASAMAPPKPAAAGGGGKGGVGGEEVEGRGPGNLEVEVGGSAEGAMVDLKISSPTVTVGAASPLASPQLQVLRAQATEAAVSERLAPPPSSAAAEAAAYAGADFGMMGSRGGNGNGGSRGGSAGGNLIIPFEGDLRTLDQITSIPRHVILSGFAAPMVDANSAVAPLKKAGGAGGAAAAAAVSLKNTTLARVAALERRKALGEVVHFLEDGHDANSRVGPESAGGCGGNGTGGRGNERVSYAANASSSGLYEYVGGGKLQWFGGNGDTGGDGGVTISRNGHVVNSRAGSIDFDRDGGAGGDDASVSTCFVSLGQTSIRSAVAAPRLVVTNGSVSGGGMSDSAEKEGAAAEDAEKEPEKPELDPEPEPTVNPAHSVVSLPSPTTLPNTPAGSERQ